MIVTYRLVYYLAVNDFHQTTVAATSPGWLRRTAARTEDSVGDRTKIHLLRD